LINLFNKQTFIESGKISKQFKLLYIQQTLNAHISSGKPYEQNCFNKVEYEEHFDPGFGKIGREQVDIVLCESKTGFAHNIYMFHAFLTFPADDIKE
jgi:hypothetical protein